MNQTVSNCLQYLAKCSTPSPCFVVDVDKLLENARILEEVGARSGAKILLALKSFATWPVFPYLSNAAHGPLTGVCASSVDEARLGREEFGGEVHAFAPAWTKEEIEELCQIADHIIFNSREQWLQFRSQIWQANQSFRLSNPIKCGLRVNPEHSEGAVAIYNPCSPTSRLGIRPEQFKSINPQELEGVSGLHFHTLCEQGAEPLQRTLEAFSQKFFPWLPRCSWLNFGGGHHITKPGYNHELLISLLSQWGKTAQIYIEPGEAVALNAGWLVATVLDIVQADMPVAVLDVSAACHMPDTLEMPYTPQAWYNNGFNQPKLASSPFQETFTCRLAGKSCLAGDNIGEYSFSCPLSIGDRVFFADMAIYSMVKTTTFNGLRLPDIAIFKSTPAGPEFKVVKTFGYNDFKNRLA